MPSRPPRSIVASEPSAVIERVTSAEYPWRCDGLQRTRSRNHRSTLHGQPSVSGFTLLEVLLSLALVAMLMIGINTFIFSMGELWGQGTDKRLFDRHVRGVTRYMTELMREAALPSSTLVADVPEGIQEIRSANGIENLITFELPEGTRQISWPEQPLPDVVCSLGVKDGEGLLLYWHSRVETKFNDEPPRSLVLTPLVSAISYDYYDADVRTWRNQTTLQKDASNQTTMPTRIHLKFSYGSFTKETIVPVPQYTNNALPLF